MQRTLQSVTQRIVTRSKATRQAYLERIRAAAKRGPTRSGLPCANLAHAFAASRKHEKSALIGESRPNVAIVSAYNDMLSAHQPLQRYPTILKAAVGGAGGVAQFAGGVPAMCDGVTQGRPGMELSLMSRDVIAMATAIALSHDMFDAGLYLGVCDKIVPGLLIGALSFGHLPAVFVPAGPMPSGLSNGEKSRVRRLHAEGKVSRETLLKTEAKAYHAPGTCNFYGTANTNQMLMEIMGLHLPGASFVPPGTPLRLALTQAAGRHAVELSALGDRYTPLGELIDERAIVNGIVGLCATGGSTNHTIHLIAIARAAGIHVTWTDFADLSSAVPLMTRIYPNGQADVNHFHAAGGMALLIGELLDADLLHADVRTVFTGNGGSGLNAYRKEPFLEEGRLGWRSAPATTLDAAVLRPVSEPFDREGGLRVLDGNLGRAVAKISAVAHPHRLVEAPARVFDDQGALLEAFEAGELDRDVVCVIRFQGPRANGMPELHKLTPPLAVLQSRGHSVAIVTDGRMSGASGAVPAAIHLTPEAAVGGPLARVRDGDPIRVDLEEGVVEALVPPPIWEARDLAVPDPLARAESSYGYGRELFVGLRAQASSAEEGALFGEVP